MTVNSDLKRARCSYLFQMNCAQSVQNALTAGVLMHMCNTDDRNTDPLITDRVSLTHTHARTHARTHAGTHAHTHTHTLRLTL